MSLVRELIFKQFGYTTGDIKIATYDISFTTNQLVEPANDPGWFLLNGAVISQSNYPILFARFGTSFNTGGEGSGNFRLPDHTEGKVPIGLGLTNFTSYAVSGGEITHTLSGVAEIASHSHGNTLSISANSHGHTPGGTTDNGGGHTHTYSLVSMINEPSSAGATQVNQQVSNGASSNNGGGSHTHTGSFSIGSATESFSKTGGVSNFVGGAGHNNMMPYRVIGGLLVKHD